MGSGFRWEGWEEEIKFLGMGCEDRALLLREVIYAVKNFGEIDVTFRGFTK